MFKIRGSKHVMWDTPTHPPKKSKYRRNQLLIQPQKSNQESNQRTTTYSNTPTHIACLEPLILKIAS